MIRIRSDFNLVKEHMKKKCAAGCADTGSLVNAADHTKELHRINRISGQLEGVRRMIENREYCPKIITQIQAIRAALKALEGVVLEKHLESCVREALAEGQAEGASEKLSEIMELFRRA